MGSCRRDSGNGRLQVSGHTQPPTRRIKSSRTPRSTRWAGRWSSRPQLWRVYHHQAGNNPTSRRWSTSRPRSMTVRAARRSNRVAAGLYGVQARRRRRLVDRTAAATTRGDILQSNPAMAVSQASPPRALTRSHRQPEDQAHLTWWPARTGRSTHPGADDGSARPREDGRSECKPWLHVSSGGNGQAHREAANSSHRWRAVYQPIKSVLGPASKINWSGWAVTAKEIGYDADD